MEEKEKAPRKQIYLGTQWNSTLPSSHPCPPPRHTPGLGPQRHCPHRSCRTASPLQPHYTCHKRGEHLKKPQTWLSSRSGPIEAVFQVCSWESLFPLHRVPSYKLIFPGANVPAGFPWLSWKSFLTFLAFLTTSALFYN